MFQESISSQDSVSTLELCQEIENSIKAHNNLLDYSKQESFILPNEMEQVLNTPLPPTTSEETQQLQWSQEELMIIEEHRIYHMKMLSMIDYIKHSGPIRKLAVPPKRKLIDLLNEKRGEKKRKQEMTPAAYHNYLHSHLQEMNKKISRKPFAFSTPPNLDNAIAQLKEAYKHLSRQNAQSMWMSILFGQFLNELYTWFQQQVEAGHIFITWDIWMRQYISISSSYARKLRNLAINLFPYKMFRCLDIPITEILSKMPLIKKMLDIEEYKQFWSQEPNIQLVNLSESQGTES